MGSPLGRGRAGRAGLGLRVELLAERGERAEGEDRLHRQAEVGGQLEGELEAGAVLAALQVADGLVVHADRGGDVVAGQAALGAQDRQPVVDLLAVATHRPPPGSSPTSFLPLAQVLRHVISDVVHVLSEITTVKPVEARALSGRRPYDADEPPPPTGSRRSWPVARTS